MFHHFQWNSPSLLPLAAGGGLLLAALVVTLHWKQLSGSWRWIIPALRISALIILAASIVRPVIVRPRTSAERGAIVLLVDRSRSMDVLDTGRTPAQLVALAEGLKLLPEEDVSGGAVLSAAGERFAALIESARLARGELDYTRAVSQSPQAAQERLSDAARRAVAFADSLVDFPELAKIAGQLGPNIEQTGRPGDRWRRELDFLQQQFTNTLAAARTSAANDIYDANDEVRQICDSLLTRPRLDLLEAGLTGAAGGVLRDLLGQAPVYGFEFADDLATVPLVSEGGQVAPLSLRPSGVRSNVSGALAAVRDRMRGQPVQAIVLISDGRQIGAGQDLEKILSTINAPIYAVNASAPAVKDVSLFHLQTPGNPFVDQPAVIRADLRGRGYAGQAVAVVLDVEGTQQTQQVTLPERGTVSVEFDLRFEHPGVQNVSLSVAPQPGEASAQNNRVLKPVRVQAERIKILALCGWPGWDFQHLRESLATSSFVQWRERILSSETARLDLSPAEILDQDVILLNDVRTTAATPRQWEAISKLASERGGSVIIIPGEPKHMVELSRQPGMADLLPFSDVQEAGWRVGPGGLPMFYFKVDPDAEDLEALQLEDDPAWSALRWSLLPPICRFMPVALPKPDVLPMLLERESGLPVLTEIPVGAGRAFFFGSRETWRWRYKVGGRDQDRFWSQLVRYAAREPFAVRDGSIAFDAEPIDAQPGEAIHVRAQISGPASAPEVRLSQAGKTIRRQAMSAASGGEAGQFEATLADLPVGDCELRVAAADVATNQAVAIHVAEDAQAELADVSGDEGSLRRIATATGGEALPLERIGELPRLIRAARDKAPTFHEYALWNSPALFWFVVGCLGLEWAMRKRLGLA